MKIPSVTMTLSLDSVRSEIDEYYTAMIEEFPRQNAADNMAALAAYTARMSYIRTISVRNPDKTMQNLRTKEVDPFITECDRQFKVWSRIVSVSEIEYATSR